MFHQNDKESMLWVKTFCRYIKAFLLLRIRKSILKLAFAKSFDKIDFLDLVEFDILDLIKFDFMDLADFVIVDRFSKVSLTPILLILLTPSNTS